jgi:hypothetical protein
MRPSDRKPFALLLSDVMAFYRRDVSEFALAVWWEACQPFSIEEVRRAFGAHTMDPDPKVCQFPPQPGDIVRALRGTNADRALVAWAKVFDAMQSAGAYRSVAFDDPVIHLAVMDLGDWPSLCRTLIDELPFVQKRFCDAYRMHSNRPGTPHPSRLIGASETQNQSAKLNEAQQRWLEGQTVLIGDPGRVQQVIATGGTAPRHQMALASDVAPAQRRIGKAA